MTEDAEWELVESLVSEAMVGLDAILSPEQFEAVRAVLEQELAFTEQGRSLLRPLLPDPELVCSDDVPLGEGAAAAKQTAPIARVIKASGDK